MSEELFKTLFKACITELKKDHYTVVDFPITPFVSIKSKTNVPSQGVHKTLMISYGSMVEVEEIIHSTAFYFEKDIESFIKMFDHEYGYNRFEGYLLGKLSVIGNNLINNSKTIVKEGF